MSHLIAFDLDGTLIDSRQDLAESANELVLAHGARPLGVDAITGMVGDGARVLVERVLSAARLEMPVEQALSEFLAIYEQRLTRHTRCYPGIQAAIEWLDGKAHLAVLTNKPTRHTRLLLEHLGLARRFRWVIGGDGRFPRKPDPASLRHVMVESRVPASRTLYVGDSMVDVETARRAGVRLCVAGYGFARFADGLALDGSELVARTPAELLPRLAEFLAGFGGATPNAT